MDNNFFEYIQIINDTDIDFKTMKKLDYNINLKIRELLNDEGIFFKLEKMHALQILKTLGIKKDKIDELYKNLISPDIFYKLIYSKKIDINDKKLLIKYPQYNVFNN